MVMGSNLYFLGVSGGVVHGLVVESLDFWGVNGGVVHGRGFESLTILGEWWRVHGCGFELTFGGQSIVVWCMVVGSKLKTFSNTTSGESPRHGMSL
jgi:hypothetical protein